VTFLPDPCELRDQRDLPGRTTVLVLPPEIDLCNAPVLRERIVAAVDDRADRPLTLVLDLTTTWFVDSQAVRLVQDVCRLLGPDVRVRVAALPDGAASRVFELTRLRRDVPVFDNLTEALGTS
jgi:stage II sporulation protein AA (anti-sigma F factor antagonist)